MACQQFTRDIATTDTKRLAEYDESGFTSVFFSLTVENKTTGDVSASVIYASYTGASGSRSAVHVEYAGIGATLNFDFDSGYDAGNGIIYFELTNNEAEEVRVDLTEIGRT